MVSGERYRLEGERGFRNWLRRQLPERTLHVRTDGRVQFFRLSTTAQAIAVSLMAGIVGWGAFSTASFVMRDQMLAVKEEQIATARLAYRSMLGQVADYQRRFETVAQDLKKNHSLMLGLVEQNASLQRNLSVVEQNLQTTRQDRSELLNQRVDLQRQLDAVHEQMQALARRNVALRGNLDDMDSGLQTALSQRDQARETSEQARKRITELETILAELEDAKQEAVERLISQTELYIGSAQKVIDLAGLEVDEIASVSPSDGVSFRDQGGPFIAALDQADGPAAALRASLGRLDRYLDHSESLQDFLRRLPLAAPLKTYRITSRYGKRRDPVNAKYAMHYGVDLSAPRRSTVYATAPGTVVFAAWNGKFGKFIEIDHGAGIHSRYGHLDKITVKKGQKVAFREAIGLMGSTGRSTGPHLHYEVLFKGRPRDPMKFIEAGLYVLQNQHERR